MHTARDEATAQLAAAELALDDAQADQRRRLEQLSLEERLDQPADPVVLAQQQAIAAAHAAIDAVDLRLAAPEPAADQPKAELNGPVMIDERVNGPSPLRAAGAATLVGTVLAAVGLAIANQRDARERRTGAVPIVVPSPAPNAPLVDTVGPADGSAAPDPDRSAGAA